MNEQQKNELKNAVDKYNSVQEQKDEHINATDLTNQLIEAAEDEVDKVIQDLKAKFRQSKKQNQQENQQN